jgi:large subunit ribosomal protein L25
MSANVSQLQAKTRSAAGKGEVRRLRTQGQIPAVAYGKGKPSTLLSVTPKDIVTVLKSEKGQNTVLDMQLEGAGKMLVMIKDYAYHPLTRNLQHVDFVQVALDQKIQIEVPVVVTGKAAGVVAGGLLRQVFRTIPVVCVPTKIPLHITIDVTALNLGDVAATQDLKLDEGVSVNLPPEQTIIAIVAPEREEEVAVAAAAAPAAGAKGAAPAAKAAAAAPAAKDAKKK